MGKGGSIFRSFFFILKIFLKKIILKELICHIKIDFSVAILSLIVNFAYIDKAINIKLKKKTTG